MIKVAITDDHPLIVTGISQILEGIQNVTYVGSANNAAQALDLLDLMKPNILLLDIDLPGMNGLELLKVIREKDLPVKVILISVHEELPIIQRALKMGADGYLLKRSGLEEIEEAIFKVGRGKKYFSDELTVGMLSKAQDNQVQNGPALARYAVLTSREKEVLSLIVDGQKNQEISEVLHISKRTVDTHRNNLMQKLDIHNTVDLVKFVLQNKL